MTDWIASYVGAESAQMVSYGLMGLAGFIGLLILYWLFKKLRHGTFISGGRSALPRLAVQDAAPVDSHRRLVLVRRDDVEHLLLIGGNTDIVVEQNIRVGGPAQRSAPEPALRERPLAEPPPDAAAAGSAAARRPHAAARPPGSAADTAPGSAARSADAGPAVKPCGPPRAARAKPLRTARAAGACRTAIPGKPWPKR